MRKIPFKLSMKVMERLNTINRSISSFVEEGLYQSQEQSRKAVNELLIRTAEKMGASLYDLCLHTTPVVERTDFKRDGDDLTATTSIRLDFVEFDVTRDEEYWRDRYVNLLNKLSQFVDNVKEDFANEQRD